MYRIVILFLVNSLFLPATFVKAESTNDQPVKVAYFYTVKWGHQNEFLALYKKNHYPVLKEQLKTGRLIDIQSYVPRLHGDGRADWTFMVVLVFKNWEVYGDGSQEAEIIKRLYPDQETFQKEEQRRFQVLEEHWDVPMRDEPME